MAWSDADEHHDLLVRHIRGRVLISAAGLPDVPPPLFSKHRDTTMGQWFKLVNLDKRKTVGLSKLCESLYDTCIHYHLAGHTYRLLTSDEYLDMERERLERTARYYPGIRRYYRGVHDQAQSPLLRKLPTEIIAMCVAAADTVRDKACFALSCLTVWDIARRDLLKALQPEMNWEGDRIMVLGEYVTADDMPPDILNDEEHAVVRAVLENPNESEDEGPPLVGELLDALGASEAAGTSVWQIEKWLSATRPCARRNHREEDSFIWSELVETEQRAVESRGAVLRNLTTHEYVRGDARRAARHAAGRPFRRTPLYSWPFGDILLMRICWSPTSDSEVLEGHNPRNVWAGHRFDFAREDALPRDAEGKVLPPWKDVSEDYMKELSEWSSQYDIVDRY